MAPGRLPSTHQHLESLHQGRQFMSALETRMISLLSDVTGVVPPRPQTQAADGLGSNAMSVEDFRVPWTARGWRASQVAQTVKESACSVGDLASIPGPGRSPGEGNGNTLQYSCLENPMDGGTWQATVHGVTKSQTWLSDFTFFLFFGLQGDQTSQS